MISAREVLKEVENKKREDFIKLNKPRMDKLKKTGIAIGVMAVVVLIAFIILNPFVIVGAGERSVVLNWGAFQGSILEPGLHYRIPVMQSVKKINVQAQTLGVEKSEAYSKDLQMVDIQSAITWNVLPGQSGIYYQQYAGDVSGLLKPRLEAAIKQVVAQYSAEEILQKRGQIQGEIFDLYKSNVPDLVEVTNYSLVNETFTPEYEAAIEAKQIAQQDAEKADNDLTRVKIEAEQTIAKAQADAESIRIQGEALKENNGLVGLKAVEKWDGKLPSYMMGGSSVPFISLPKSDQ